jgi:hypothetical protein
MTKENPSSIQKATKDSIHSTAFTRQLLIVPTKIKLSEGLLVSTIRSGTAISVGSGNRLEDRHNLLSDAPFQFRMVIVVVVAEWFADLISTRDTIIFNNNTMSFFGLCVRF